MQGDGNPKGGIRRGPIEMGDADADCARVMGESIRQAFLARIDVEQRQHAGDRPSAAGRDRTRSDDPVVDDVRQQQHTGNHDKPGEEAEGSDSHGGTRDGAENVEPQPS
jgi:hypothetical protein